MSSPPLSDVPKETNDESINLDAPRKRGKTSTDQEMITVKKVKYITTDSVHAAESVLSSIIYGLINIWLFVIDKVSS